MCSNSVVFYVLGYGDSKSTRSLALSFTSFPEVTKTIHILILRYASRAHALFCRCPTCRWSVQGLDVPSVGSRVVGQLLNARALKGRFLNYQNATHLHFKTFTIHEFTLFCLLWIIGNTKRTSVEHTMHLDTHIILTLLLNILLPFFVSKNTDYIIIMFFHSQRTMTNDTIVCE